jgi:starch synthase
VVCPYTEASQSGVVPIAYAFKKPVIVTRVGCLPDYVEDGGTGLIVDPGDSRPLAFAIIKLLGDPGLRKQMGEKGWRKMVAELSWEQIAQTTVKTYHEAIKRREIQHDQLPILDSITKK